MWTEWVAGARRLARTLTTLLSHYRRHPGQTAFMATGLITGVALWSAVQLINDHARSSYAEADRLMGAQAHYWIRARDGGDIPVEAYIALRRGGFKGVYPVIEARVRDQQGRFIPLIATDLLALPFDPEAGAGQPAENPFSADNWLPLIQPPYQTWYPEALADRLGVVAGERLALAGGKRLPPARVRSGPRQGQRLFLDVGAAMAVLGNDGFSYLAVGPLDQAARIRLERKLHPGLHLLSNRQALDLRELTSSLHTNLSALGLLSFVVGLFIVASAVRFSLQARRLTISTLRELGVPAATIGLAIGLESLLWSIVGTCLGMLAGYLLAHLLLPAVAVSLQSLFDAALGPDLHLNPVQLAKAFLLTLAGVTLALAAPLWRGSGERNPRSSPGPAGGVKGGALLAPLLLALSAAVLYPSVDSVRAGFVVLGLVLFASALLLPPLLQGINDLIATSLPERLWQVRWAVSDAHAQLPQLRIALMALLLTLTTNIGVTTMVQSFHTALGDWLDYRLDATLYVHSDSLRREDLRGAGWMLARHQRVDVDLRWGGRPATVVGLDMNAPDTERLRLVLAEPGALASWRVSAGPVVPILASEQLLFLAGTALGAVIELDTPAGPMPFRMVGLFHDYGNAGFKFYLPGTVVKTLWPGAEEQGLALWVREGQEDAAIRALVAAGASPGDWQWQRDIRRATFSIFDRTFAITSSLNALTLLVAGTALLAALTALHQQRLPQYCYWYSLGINHREWLAIVALPLLLMVLVTGLLALPLGLLLSWLLIHKLNVIAFGWTMPVLWAWKPAGHLALLTGFIVVLALGTAAAGLRRALPGALRRFQEAGT